MLRCIYGLVQAPRQYYMLCREVYQEASLKQLQTDERVFIRYVSNIIRQPSLTHEDLLVNCKFLNMEIVPMPMHVYKSRCHAVAVMVLVMYLDNNGIRHNCEDDIGVGNCLIMLRCIYGIVQALRQYYMLYREVYQ